MKVSQVYKSKIFCVFVFIIMCLVFNIKSVSALKISEIMYDPAGSDTGREWIEIYNDENNNLSIGNGTYKFYEANANHSISGTDILLSGEYAIIADDINKFKIDYPTYIGAIYGSSFLLSNSGETLTIKHKSVGDSEYKIISEINYTPYVVAVSNGTACDMGINGASNWRDCIATPGIANEVSGGAGTESSTSTASSTASSTSSGSGQTVYNSVAVGISYYVPNTNIYLRIGNMTLESQKDKSAIAGIETDMIVRAYDNKGIAVKGLKYYWSMGEGGYYEGENIKYIYHMPGDYEYTVEAGNDNSYSMYRGSIHVYEPKIKIFSLGTTSNYINIKNDIDTEMDIGGYILRDNINNKSYKIARNTFIKANKELRLIGAAVGFVSTSSDNFTLSSANGVLIHQYFPIIKPNLPIAKPAQSLITSTNTQAIKLDSSKVITFNTKNINLVSINKNIKYSHSLRY